MAYEKEIKVAIDAVRQAGRLCQQVAAQITPHVIEKKDRSPVTVADFGSQALICRALGDGFPDDPIIAEEDSQQLHQQENDSQRQQVVDQVRAIIPEADETKTCQWIDRGNHSDYCDRFWTLDPIDGTKGFIRREQYAISLALIVEGRIVVAVLGCPNLLLDPTDGSTSGALFGAVLGGGAFVQSLEAGSEPMPICVSSIHRTDEARICESVEAGHSSHRQSQTVAERLNITAKPIRLDSQAKYATVARGEADIYLRLPTRGDYVEKIWDHAGGVLVVTEAGGTVTDVTGKPLDFTHGWGLSQNRGVVVTNGKLHEKVLATLAEVGVG